MDLGCAVGQICADLLHYAVTRRDEAVFVLRLLDLSFKSNNLLPFTLNAKNTPVSLSI